MEISSKHKERIFLAGLVIGALAFPLTVATLLGADNVVDYLKGIMSNFSF